MRLLLILLVLVLGLGVAAAATRPGEAEFDATLDQAIRDKVAKSDIGEGKGGPLSQVALAGCKLRPSDCVKLVRRALDVQFEEHTFYTRVAVEGLERRGSCIGAFGRFFCRDLLKDQA